MPWPPGQQRVSDAPCWTLWRGAVQGAGTLPGVGPLRACAFLIYTQVAVSWEEEHPSVTHFKLSTQTGSQSPSSDSPSVFPGPCAL